MAFDDAHGNPIAAQAPVPAQAPVAGQPLNNVNRLNRAFWNPKADIPVFYGDSTLDNVCTKFLLD